MPYVAHRKFTMFGQQFAWPGNGYDLPHIVPAEMVERMPVRALNNMLSRGMIKQVEAVASVPLTPIALATALGARPPGVVDVEADSRVSKEGHGWYLVDGKRVHGLKGVKRALTELGG